ncbi:MAG: hypothetical protein GX483_04840 [Actinomycetaceae bacterium]|nr:hypothetical protein [Actinomycetaceae bacterium]
MKRLYVSIAVKMESDWRIGDLAAITTTGSDSADDRSFNQVLRDPVGGNLYVPGSSIAGSLRAAARTFGDFFAEKLFGADFESIEDSAKKTSASKDNKNDDAAAVPEPEFQVSPWWVLGTTLTQSVPDRNGNDATSQTTSRIRNRIDRHRGAADNGALFNMESVTGRAEGEPDLVVYLRRDCVDSEDAEQAKTDLHKVLQAWRPRLGGGASVGMGRARVQYAKYRVLDVADTDDLVELLKYAEDDSPCGRVAALLETVEKSNVEPTSTDAYVRAEMTVPFLAFSEELAKAGKPLRIHGSTWKGLLRSRVEYIGRSLGFEVCDGTEERETRCDVCDAFGSVDNQGLWIFQDSPVTEETDLPKRSRIAIDRFTGGARDGALFEQYYVRDAKLILQIDRTSRQGEPADWVEKALLWALRDLNDGLISVGPEGASGYGMANIEQVELRGEPIDLSKLDPMPVPSTSPESSETQEGSSDD